MALVAADQVSKALVGRALVDGRLHSVGLGSGFRRVHNRRAALVPMPVGWGAALWAAAMASAAVALALASSMLGVAGAIGVGFLIGGATSNLADRLLRGAVLDFIAVGRWPTFNLADAAMVAGALLITGALL